MNKNWIKKNNPQIRKMKITMMIRSKTEEKERLFRTMRKSRKDRVRVKKTEKQSIIKWNDKFNNTKLICLKRF